MGIKSGVKDITKDLAYCLGICRALLWFSGINKRPKLAILVYHRACAAGEDQGYMSIPIDAFEQHMRFIKNNFKIVSMKEGMEDLHRNNKGGISVAINFDDGYMDNYLYAYPVLKKYGIPATVFLTTDYIGERAVFWWDRVFNTVSLREEGARLRGDITDHINGILRTKRESKIQSIIEGLENNAPLLKKAEPSRMLGWEEIKEMKRNGIDFCSHTRTHRNLRLLKDDEVREELAGSKKEIEKNLGEEVAGFAYPFGIFDERIKRLAREAGYGYARAGLKRVNNKEADRFSVASICAGDLLKTSFLAARISLSLLKTH